MRAKLLAANDIFRRVQKNNDAKVLVGNFASLSVLQISNYVLPLITLPYLAKTLGAHFFGVLAFSNATLAYLQGVTDYGFNFTGTRDVAIHREDKKKVSKIFSDIITTKLYLLLLTFLTLIILILTIPFFKDKAAVLLASYLCLPGLVLFPDWLFQGLERMKYSSMLNILSKALFTLLTFLVVKKEEDYIWVPILTAAGNFCAGGIAIYIIAKNRFVENFRLSSFKDMIATLKSSFDVFINQFIPNLYNNFSTILLGFYAPASMIGVLDAARRLVLVPEQFLSLLSRTFFPFISRNINRHKWYEKISLIVSMVVSVMLFLLADYLVGLLYNKEYAESANILKWLAFSPFLFFLVNTYGTNYLLIVKKEKLLRNITLIASVIGCGVAIVLIPVYKMYGVVWTILIARAIIGINCLVKAKSVKAQTN